MEDRVKHLRNFFEEDKTLSFKWREQQIKALQQCMFDHEADICELVFFLLLLQDFDMCISNSKLVVEHFPKIYTNAHSKE